MRKIYIPFVLLTVALVAVPVGVAAQMSVAQVELTEGEKLAHIAIQLDDIEDEVNRLTLLVTKVALERQAAELQRRLAIATQPKEFTAGAPVAAQPVQQDASKAAVGQPAKSLAQPDIQAGPPQSSEAGLGGEDDDNKASGFGAGLGLLGNLGTPEIAALLILGFLAVFVLVRRLSDRKKSPAPRMPQAPTTPSQTQPTLLDEGRQDLAEKVAWK